MPRLTAAQTMVHLLERQGIRIIPGIPGGMNLPLYDALSSSTCIRHVLARHEQGAGFIAQGMARSSGQTAACLATSGPGATNLLTAVADAKLDSVPLVCITGQVPLGLIGTDAFQEIDVYGASIPLTKHNYLVRRASELLEVIPEAFRIAASGRPGPVLIDVPKDVQNQMLDFARWPEPGQPDSEPEASGVELQAAADMINRSRRPVLLLGGGVISGQAAAAARRFAEQLGLTVAMTLMGLGAFPNRHPLALGLIGMHGAGFANFALEACDLLIAVGARFGDRSTGKVAEFCPQAAVVHVDIDPGEINKIKTASVAVHSHARPALEALLGMVGNQPRPEWAKEVAALQAAHPLSREGQDDVFTPYGLLQAVARIMGDGGFIATDVGQHQMWTAQNYPFSRPRQFLTSGGLGTMGFGLPAAMGAALQHPGETAVCVSGDGSLLMNIQELATLAEENLNVKIILLNNQALGLVRQQQDLFYGGRRFASLFRHNVDFTAVAKGFGVPAVDLGAGSRPETDLTRMLEAPGPALIHVPVDRRINIFPMVPPGAANRDMIGGEVHA